MPKFIYGTAWKKEQTASLVCKAINAGFRGIDTACQPKHYNEAGVGAALKEIVQQGIARKNLYLQSKFTPLSGQDPSNVPYDTNASIKDQVNQSFSKSKLNLGTDYLDCLILHSPMDTFDETLEVWYAMEQLNKEGHIKQLGISNCYDINTLQALYKEAKVKPKVLQNRFYPETNFDKNLRSWCLESDIIYQSFWTLTANMALLSNPTLIKIADHIDKTPAQILFRYLSQVGIVPLTGTTTDKHMKEDLEIFKFELSKTDIDSITGLL